MLAEITCFVNWVHRRNPSSRTWKDYQYDLNLFQSVVGDKPIQEIDIHDIDQFINFQLSRGYKPTTINRRLSSVLSLFTFLSDEILDLVCPVLPHRHHLREPQRLPKPVTQEILKLFFNAIKTAPPPKGKPDVRDRDIAIFVLMLRCGLRISEVSRLLISNLFLDELFPRILVQGKRLRERTVYLSPQAENRLRNYLSLRPSVSCDFVFLSYLNSGLSTTAIHKRLMFYRNQANISLTSHQLRHNFANDLLGANVPVTTIQKLLGHRWLETTQNYVMANDRQVQEDYYAACEKLEDWQ